MKARVPEFASAVLERTCEILADTHSGLTGSEIGKLLALLGIDDPSPEATKRVRLFHALSNRQSADRCGNLVVAFIEEAMKPVRHTGSPGWFDEKRHEVNTALAFAGYELGADGKLRVCQPAKTLPQAEERAGRLRAELSNRHYA